MIRSLNLRLTALAFVALGTQAAVAGETPAPVSVKVDGLSPYVAAAVQEKAGQGINELRRYVERTRMIHALYLPDLVRPGDGEATLAATPAAPAIQGKMVVARNTAKTRKPQTAVAASRQKSAVAIAKAPRPAAPLPARALARAGSPTSRA